MNFDKFTCQDYPQYRSWFEDPVLNHALGPMEEYDEPRLAQLDNTDSIVYKLSQDEKLLGVICIALPKLPEYPEYAITSIASKPGHKRKGYARLMIQKCLQIYPNQKRVAYVNKQNQSAMNLFVSLGWKISDDQTSEDMYTMIYTDTPPQINQHI